uniref:Uncharacterized protein LOC116941401 n=1 Tax=Petromyzon marinus TaxID=7757 RepID=A0AAJ7SZJ9_PETMA|nr:uncharacterized protein LOC116941401 [Petromyzon marinus]
MPRGAKMQPRGAKGKEEAAEEEAGAANATAAVDTSAYSVEERLVASVWVHERRHTGDTLAGLRTRFVARFGREAAPTKASLLKWERKTFATGSVRDLPRCGRASTRRATCAAVAESVRRYPGKSTRQRSAELGVPRSTMKDHIKKDLQGGGEVRQQEDQQRRLPVLYSGSPQSRLEPNTAAPGAAADDVGDGGGAGDAEGTPRLDA